MKRMLLSLSLVGVLTACQQSEKSVENADQAGGGDRVSETVGGIPSVTDTANNPAAVSTDEFAAKAVTGGIMEVTLGKLAQQKAISAEVRKLGETIATDHTAANQTLTQIAAAKGIALPTDMTPEQHEHHKKLEGLNGAEFDREYVRMMVDDHNQDIADFGAKASSEPKDELSAFAEQTLPTLRKHLQMAQALVK